VARPRTPSRALASANANTPYWELPAKERGSAVERLVEHYKSTQSSRRQAYVRNLELFECRTLQGYSAHSFAEVDGAGADFERRRLVRSAVQTAVANIYAPQKPKPQFQTLGATWATRRRAYKLDRICEGILNQSQGRWINVWSFMIDAGAEVALQGVGAILVEANQEEKRIDHELIPLPDIYCDPVEGRTPQNWFMRRPMAESQALARWPKFAAAIRGANDYSWYGVSSAQRPRAERIIEVKYAWHLPTRKRGTGGKGKRSGGAWSCVINGVEVEGGEWTAPTPPLVLWYWEPHRDGIWGAGIGDEGGRMSMRIDDLDQRLHYRELIASGQQIFYHKDTCKPDDLAINEARTVIAVEDGKQFPQVSTPPPFHPSELQFLESEIRGFWDGIGISQVSAAARREQGVESGVAMRTLNDTKAGRQLVKAQRYEQAYVDLARQYVWRLRELAEDDKNFMVSWSGKTIIRSYKWSDADVEDDDFSVTVAPASALPHDPAGRQAMIGDLYGQGLISQETAKQLMQWPDLESEMTSETAEAEYVEMLIELYLDAEQKSWSAGDYEAPESFIINKPQAMRKFIGAWARARIDAQTLPKAERRKAQFNIALLVRYIRELDGLMAASAAAGAALQPAPAGGAAAPGPAGLPQMPAGTAPMLPAAA
jgi:hypothetical protein